VLVANHQNGLFDALLLMAGLGRDPRFFGKSALFKILPLSSGCFGRGPCPVSRCHRLALTGGC